MSKIPPTLLSGAKYAGMRIGILGGSFNPAHDGHLHISMLALKRMKLDQIWWVVSPQNPLKSNADMAGFDKRLQSAKAAAKHPKIIVSDIEAQLGTRFTADTLRALKARFPRTRFVWMMGADNMLQIPRWENWQQIFKLVDIAVFRRPPYAVGVLRGIAAARFQNQRVDNRKAALLARQPLQTGFKNWVLFSNRLNNQSATRIRAKHKNFLGAFLGKFKIFKKIFKKNCHKTNR